MTPEADLELVNPPRAGTTPRLDKVIARQHAGEIDAFFPDQPSASSFPAWWRRSGWERFWRWAEDRVELRARLRRLGERPANELNSRRQITEHQFRVNAQRSVAEPPELFVAPAISGATVAVHDGAVNFDDEPSGGREEICDGAADDDLPAERSAELSRVDGGPERGFGRGQMAAHERGTVGEQRRAGEVVMASAQIDLLGPAKRPGSSSPGAEAMPGARREARAAPSPGGACAPLARARPLRRAEAERAFAERFGHCRCCSPRARAPPKRARAALQAALERQPELARQQAWSGDDAFAQQPLPSRASRRRAGIGEGQGTRRLRAQRAQASNRQLTQFYHASPRGSPSTRARAEHAGGGQHDNPLNLVDPSGFLPGDPVPPSLGHGPGRLDRSRADGPKFNKDDPATWNDTYRKTWKSPHKKTSSDKNREQPSAPAGDGSKAHPDAAQAGSADGTKGVAQPDRAATDHGTGNPGESVDEGQRNNGTKPRPGVGSTIVDDVTVVVGIVNGEGPSDRGQSGGIPGGQCEGSRCISGPGVQAAWVVIVIFGNKLGSKAKGLWEAVKAAGAAAKKVAGKVVDAAADRVAKAVGRRAAARGGFRIVEQVDDVVEIAGKIAGNEIRVLANISREGGTLFLRQVHIQGPGAGKVGVKGLFDAAREFGRSQGASKVVIEGAKRSTGAGNQRGAVPRVWEILVE
jgi:hypothetical protein